MRNSWILFFLVAFQLSCVSIRVYVPGKFPIPPEPLGDLLVWEEISEPNSDYEFAKIDPYLFSLLYKEKYRNKFGGLQRLFEEELIRNRKLYFPESKPLKFSVKKFDLISKDRCRKSFTESHLRADVTDATGKLIYTYDKKDSIESRVTDCYTLGMGMTLIGLVWYLPYQGFRGDREDQLNQLGTLALQDFFEGFQNSLKTPKTGQSVPKIPIPGADTKEKLP